MTTTRIHRGDLLAWMRWHEPLVQDGYLPRAHAVFCDPPYFLGSISKRFGGPTAAPAKYGTDGLFQRQSKGFMNQTWDGFSDVWEYQQWVTEWGRLLLSFVYPGAVLACFGGTRTYHRLAAGLEDAGWIVFDCCMYCYSSGFPKGHRQERDFQIARHGGTLGMITNEAMQTMTLHERLAWLKLERQWRGFNINLSPSYEPILLARAPWSGTYAGIAQQYGTGAINVDAGRISTEEDDLQEMRGRSGGHASYGPKDGNVALGKGLGSPIGKIWEPKPLGRWPKNLILSCACESDAHDAGCPVAVLNANAGKSAPRPVKPENIGKSGTGEARGLFGMGSTVQTGYYDQSSDAARFYYTAKSAKWEREAGLHARAAVTVNDGRHTPIDNPYQRGDTKRKNTHPTCKPIKLTEYLAGLLLPPPLAEPRRLLVPFSGVGSEMIGAGLAGWDEVIGFEQSDEYVDIAESRIPWWAQFDDYEQAKRAWDADHAEAVQRADEAEHGLQQMALFEAVRA